MEGSGKITGKAGSSGFENIYEGLILEERCYFGMLWYCVIDLQLQRIACVILYPSLLCCGKFSCKFTTE